MVLRIILVFFFYNTAVAEDLQTITAEDYLQANPSVERQAIVDAITKQFNGKIVTQAKIEDLWSNELLKNTFKIARFQIINQKLYTDCFLLSHYYFQMLLEYFSYLVKTYKISDVDFIIYLREEMPMDIEIAMASLSAPGFMMFQDQASSYETDKLLFPDAYFFKKEWGELIDKIEKANDHYPRQTKINKIFWRGGATGGAYHITNFAKFVRIKAVMLSKLYPEIIDADFAGYLDQITQDQDGKNFMQLIDILSQSDKKRVSEIDHLKYKYLLSLDGNTATGTRVPWIMVSSSTLIKQETLKSQWYYSALKPYIHYVPLREDLTDIFSQFEWMKNNDDKLQQISLNGQNFVKNNLMPADIDAQVIIILNEYHKIQQDRKLKATLPSSDDIMTLPYLIKNLFYRLKVKYFVF